MAIHVRRELETRDDLEVVPFGDSSRWRDARDDVVVGDRKSGQPDGDGLANELLRRETAVRERRVCMQFGKACGGDLDAPSFGVAEGDRRRRRNLCPPDAITTAPGFIPGRL